MLLVLVIPAVIFAAQFVGVRYGWGYHAAILALLGALMPALVRLPLSILPKAKFDPSIFDTPEGRELGQKVAAIHEQNERLNRQLRIDAFVFSILLVGPTIAAMAILRQDLYRPEHRHWFWIGLLLFGLYFVFRYVLPQRKKA